MKMCKTEKTLTRIFMCKRRNIRISRYLVVIWCQGYNRYIEYSIVLRFSHVNIDDML